MPDEITRIYAPDGALIVGQMNTVVARIYGADRRGKGGLIEPAWTAETDLDTQETQIGADGYPVYIDARGEKWSEQHLILTSDLDFWPLAVEDQPDGASERAHREGWTLTEVVGGSQPAWFIATDEDSPVPLEKAREWVEEQARAGSRFHALALAWVAEMNRED